MSQCNFSGCRNVGVQWEGAFAYCAEHTTPPQNEGVRLMQQRIRELYAQHDADVARIAVLEAIACHVAAFDDEDTWYDRCPHCHGPTVAFGSVQHNPGCVVVNARSLLAKEAPATK